MPKCATCPVPASAPCLGESAPRLCTLAADRDDYRRQLVALAGATPPPPLDLDADGPPAVTVFAPLSGRAAAWPRYAAWLDAQARPRDRCRLVLCDTSQSEDFHRTIRAWALGSGWSDVRVYRQTVAPPGLADLPRAERAFAVTEACKRIYRRAARELATEFLLVVEDDVVPPPDALARLLRGMEGPEVAAVSGLYLERHDRAPRPVAWGPPGRGPLALDGPDVEAVGGSGFGCLLLRRKWIEGETFAAGPRESGYYDVDYSARVVAAGGVWLLDRTTRCAHLGAPPFPAAPAAPAYERCPRREVRETCCTRLTVCHEGRGEAGQVSDQDCAECPLLTGLLAGLLAGQADQ